MSHTLLEFNLKKGEEQRGLPQFDAVFPAFDEPGNVGAVAKYNKNTQKYRHDSYGERLIGDCCQNRQYDGRNN